MRKQNENIGEAYYMSTFGEKLLQETFMTMEKNFFGFINVCKISRFLECDVIYVRRQVRVFKTLLRSTPR